MFEFKFDYLFFLGVLFIVRKGGVLDIIDINEFCKKFVVSEGGYDGVVCCCCGEVWFWFDGDLVGLVCVVWDGLVIGYVGCLYCFFCGSEFR